MNAPKPVSLRDPDCPVCQLLKSDQGHRIDDGRFVWYYPDEEETLVESHMRMVTNKHYSLETPGVERARAALYDAAVRFSSAEYYDFLVAYPHYERRTEHLRVDILPGTSVESDNLYIP